MPFRIRGATSNSNRITATVDAGRRIFTRGSIIVSIGGMIMTKAVNRSPLEKQQQQQSQQQRTPEMREYLDQDELDTSDDEVLEDAPPLQEPDRPNYGSEHGWYQQHPIYTGVFGARDQTVQAWQWQQEQQEQQQQQRRRRRRRRGRQQPSGYEDWLRDRDGIRNKDVADWNRGQRRQLEEQRESLCHLYCEAEKVKAMLQAAHEERQRQQQQQISRSGPWSQQEQEQEQQQQQQHLLPIPGQQLHTPPRTPSPSPLPSPPSQTPVGAGTGAARSSTEGAEELTHAQKILHLLVYTTQLRRAVCRTAALVGAHEARLPAFFDGLAAAVDRVTDRLDALWRAEHRADARGGHGGGDGFPLDGDGIPVQIEFCAAWERIVDGYGEVVRREHALFAAEDPLGGGGGRGEEEWRDYLGALGVFGDRVGAFGERLREAFSETSKGPEEEGKEEEWLRGREIPKARFPGWAWRDSMTRRQLIEHFANLHLNRLELIKIALECLMNRQLKERHPGDRVYALMGLLRIRPPIDKTDSSFQAFARLSLPQDSDRLMERLICLLPNSPDESWEVMSDQYQASLWDIYPDTQACAIGENDTVIVDGAKGAQIEWSGFKPVRSLRKITIKRTVLFVILRYSSTIFFTGHYYAGKLWAVEPCFFGIEGYVPLEVLEERLFGSLGGKDGGRLSWSACGSPLSRHTQGEPWHERTVRSAEKSHQQQQQQQQQQPHPSPAPLPSDFIDTYPIKAINPTSPCPESLRGKPGELKVFTLMDTLNLTVTLFLAARPPTVLVVAGSEGGMKRAIACSLDATTGTLYRETVLRLPSQCADRMESLPRIRLGPVDELEDMFATLSSPPRISSHYHHQRALAESAPVNSDPYNASGSQNAPSPWPSFPLTTLPGPLSYHGPNSNKNTKRLPWVQAVCRAYEVGGGGCGGHCRPDVHTLVISTVRSSTGPGRGQETEEMYRRVSDFDRLSDLV
ncbi:hypothetical protein VTG60DRAFT_6636 [Thermothelomyces hinnuleus]